MQSYYEKNRLAPEYSPISIHQDCSRPLEEDKVKDGSKRLHKVFSHHPAAFCGGLHPQKYARYEPGSPSTASHTKSPARKLTQLYFVWSSTSHPPRVFQVKIPPWCFSTLSLKPTWNHGAESHLVLTDGMI